MSVKRGRGSGGSLEGLADFLNSAGPSATQKDWRSFMKRIAKNAIGLHFRQIVTNVTTGKGGWQDRVTLNEAKSIRSDLHNSLAYLRATKPLQDPYGGLAYHLTELKLETRYQCFSLTGKPRPGQAILRSHGKRWVARAWPLAKTTKDLLYTVLAGALVDGSLNRLKVCRECTKYIAVKDTKRRFCSDRCKDNFFNRQKLQDPESKKIARIKRALTK